MVKVFTSWFLITIALLCFAAAPIIAKKQVQKHTHTTRAEVIDSIMLTVAKEAGRVKGATVTNELGAIFKFIAGNHPASINAVNAIVQMSRDPQAKVDASLGQTIFGKYPEYKAAANQLEKLVKSSASSQTVAAFIPIALARPEQVSLDEAEKYIREATKDKNAKPADVANSLYEQHQKQPLNFVTKTNSKWVIDASIAAMLVASGGDMIDTSTFNDHLTKSHNYYLRDTNDVVIVF